MLVTQSKNITPFILGSGHAGQAAAKSLAALAILRPELGLNPAQWLPRTSDLKGLCEAGAEPLLVISNPHGLHAKTILAAEAAGIKFIVVEKRGVCYLLPSIFPAIAGGLQWSTKEACQFFGA